MTAPEQKLEGLTPLQVEQRLRYYNAELETAVADLRAARQAELVALDARKEAYEEAMLSDECPPVSRETNTVAYRDAWIGRRIRTEDKALLEAKTERQKASDYLSTVKEQVSIFQSINKGVDTAYRSFR